MLGNVSGEEGAGRDHPGAALAELVEGAARQLVAEAPAAEPPIDLAVRDDNDAAADAVVGEAAELAVHQQLETMTVGVVADFDVTHLPSLGRAAPYPRTVSNSARRLAAVLSSAVLGLALLAGCSSDNVDCGPDRCVVTLERDVNASASVLGVEARFVSADEDTVTLEIAGEQVKLTKGRQAVDVGGLQVALDSITGDSIKFRVSRA